MQNDIDHVLKRSGTGDGPVLGDVADENDCHTAGLGRSGQRSGDGSHLGHPAHYAVDVPGGHGLH